MSESGDGTGATGSDHSRPDVGGAGSGGTGDEPRRSGLRNPAAAVRGVGVAALGAQGATMMLAIVPLHVLGAGGNVGSVILGALALVSFALAGFLQHRWAWWVASLLPLAQFACGFVVHVSIGVAGVVFGLVWLYVLRVRHTVLGGGGLTRRGSR